MANVIIHLGGDPARVQQTIKTAKENPDALIIVSTEGENSWMDQQFKAAGISRNRYVFDFNAWDTVTNFTKTKRWVMRQRPSKLFIVTNEFHMLRSQVIAQCVFFGEDVEIISCSVANRSPRSESWQLVMGDLVRALIWRLTGIVIFDPKVKAERMSRIASQKALAEADMLPIS